MNDKKDKTIIEINNFTKKYGKTIAVKNLNLKIKKGSIFGFIGPNGAGKTTTIRTMLNFIKPTEGEIKLFGLNSIKYSKEIKIKTGYVPSENYLYPHLSVYNHLKLTAEFYKISKEKFKENLNKYTKYFNLDLNKKVKELSHGNKRKLFITIALIHDPELIIFDEPTNGLDPVIQKRFQNLLKKLTQSGKTIFFSSHNLYEVENLCTDVAIIKDGNLIDYFEMEEFVKRDNNSLSKVFEKYFTEEIESIEI